MSFAVQVNNLSKQYRRGLTHAGSIRELVNRAVNRLWRRHAEPLPHEANGQTVAGDDPTFWALREVSLEVQPGEVVGVIGRNGAGKSTLFKLLSRITAPTAGRIELHGRIASLLEVGTGFHPELTGRENVFLNGAILGMTKPEIRRKFDAIVAFSEIGSFIDTPVKRYSSGMYVRLAFAVAAHLDPEILVIDEVLAVGDAQFQRKCLGRMGQVAKEGRTVLFVSHNMTAVRKLCSRVVWLDNGRVKGIGDTKEIVPLYLAQGDECHTERIWHSLETAPGNDMVRICRASIRPGKINEGNVISMDCPLTVEIEFWNNVENAALALTLLFHTQEDIIAFGTSTAESLGNVPMKCGFNRGSCTIPGNLLNSGRLRVDAMIVRDGTNVLYQHEGLLSFTVLDNRHADTGWHGKRAGVVRPLLEWELGPAEPNHQT